MADQVEKERGSKCCSKKERHRIAEYRESTAKEQHIVGLLSRKRGSFRWMATGAEGGANA